MLPSFFLQLFAEKKSFKWKNQLSLFCRNVREKFSDIWKNPEFIGKSLLRVEKHAFFVTEKNVRENRTFLRKINQLQWNYQTRAKIQIFCRNRQFFSNFFGRQFQFFGGIFENNFFCKEFFFVFAPSNISGTFEETFFAVMLKLHSRCPQRNSRSFLFRKQTLFQFFFGLWAKEVRFLKENFERYCQKTLLHY